MYWIQSYSLDLFESIAIFENPKGYMLLCKRIINFLFKYSNLFRFIHLDAANSFGRARSSAHWPSAESLIMKMCKLGTNIWNFFFCL